ncbi:hypothetical protein C8R43DRAFT_336152 [Mycena crocata]|nr:hypothetical protein C8R43DRAFT_336152 [Mycena crocata]
MGGVDHSFPDTRSYYFPQQSFHTTAAPRNISYPSEQHSAAPVAGPMLSNSTYRIQPQQVHRPRRAQLLSAASFGGFDLCSRSPNSISPEFFANQSRMENYVRPALHSNETSPLPNRPISVAPRGPTYRDPSRLPSASFSGCGLPAHSATIFSAQPSWVENRGTSEQMHQQPPHPSRSNVGLQVQNGSLRTLPSAPIGGPSKGHLNQFCAGPLTMQSASTSPVSEAAPAPYDDAAPEVSHLQSQPAPRSFKWIVYAPEDGRCQDLPQRNSDSETSYFEPTEVDSAFDIVAGNAVPDKEQSQNTTEGILAEEATHLEEEVESVEEDEQSDEGEKAVDEIYPTWLTGVEYPNSLRHPAYMCPIHYPTYRRQCLPLSKEAWLINAAWPRDLKAMNTCSVSPKDPNSDDTMLRLPWTPNSTK